MNDDSAAAAKLSKAAREIEALLHPSTAPPATICPAAPAAPAASWSKMSKMDRFCSIVGIVALCNFVAFLIGAAALGGGAINGKTEGGRYYVADHGKLTEVSKAGFTYSRIHAYTLFVTHPLAMICGLAAYMNMQSKRRGE